MFLIPPHLGLSFVFSTLIKNIDFKGNIYIIDDYKYELSLEEIKKVDGPKITFEKYYEAIKDIFQDGDIIVGYSLGCIFAPLLCERLEKSNKIDKCILIDGTLNFINNFQFSDENINQLIKEANEFNISEIKNENEDELRNKMVEITISNSKWEFHEPKVDTLIIYLSADNDFKEQLDRISSDYEIIKIDSTHQDIIEKDIDKIKKYFK